MEPLENAFEVGEWDDYGPGPDGFCTKPRRLVRTPGHSLTMSIYVVAGTRVSPAVVEYPDLKQLTAQSRHDSMTGKRLFVIHDVKEEA
jgi:hypothetical protein